MHGYKWDGLNGSYTMDSMEIIFSYTWPSTARNPAIPAIKVRETETRSKAMLCNCWKLICTEFILVSPLPVNTVLRWPSRHRMTRQAAHPTARGIGAQGGWRDRRRHHRMTGRVYLWQWRLLLRLSEDWSQSGK